MIWANTSAIIAMVADKHTIRYWAVMEFPRETMNSNARTPFIIKSHTTISPIKGACPFPTGIGFVDVFPKSLFYRIAAGVIKTNPGTIATRSVGRLIPKLMTAIVTFTLFHVNLLILDSIVPHYASIDNGGVL